MATVAKSSWKLEKPNPYGVQNPARKNPFITEVLEYCEGGKVTADCADSIKRYLENITETVATPDAARSVQTQRATSALDVIVAATGAWDYAAYDNKNQEHQGEGLHPRDQSRRFSR